MINPLIEKYKVYEISISNYNNVEIRTINGKELRYIRIDRVQDFKRGRYKILFSKNLIVYKNLDYEEPSYLYYNNIYSEIIIDNESTTYR